MSEKELLYIEDIYNHEKLIISVEKEFLKKIKNKDYSSLLKKHIAKFETLIKKKEKLLEEKSND